MSDLRHDISKVIDICIQAKRITSESLKAAIQEFLNEPMKKGRMSYSSLVEKSHGKLENIEITESNIQDFKSVAAKYDIDYSLKRDKSTDPPTYHVFFAAASAERFEKAFTEYLSKASERTEPKHQLNIERVRQCAKAIEKDTVQHNKQRVRKREKQASL